MKKDISTSLEEKGGDGLENFPGGPGVKAL
jgi:hypothetical protein